MLPDGQLDTHATHVSEIVLEREKIRKQVSLIFIYLYFIVLLLSGKTKWVLKNSEKGIERS